MEFYIKEVKADGFRCDVGDQVPLDFWAEGIKRIKTINPDVIMLNEGSDATYFQELDINYGMFTMNAPNNVFLDTEDVRLGKEINSDRTQITVDEFKKLFSDTYHSVPDGKFILINAQNHDTASDLAERRPDVYLGSNAGVAILTLVFTMNGVPMIYNGDEVFDTLPKNMFWNRFCEGVHTVRWENLLTDVGKKRLEFIKELIALRRERASLTGGNIEWLEHTNEDAVLFYKREFNGEKTVCLINTTAREQKTSIDAKINKILISKNAQIEDEITLKPYGFVIFE
jgi:glycosidase